MRISQLFLTGFLLLYFFSGAQINPENNARLNFTQILFETKAVPNAEYYRFKIYSDTLNSPIIDTVCTGNALILNQFVFGTTYYWTVSEGSRKQSNFSRFSIVQSELINTEKYRFNATKNSGNNLDDLILIDYNRIAITRTGVPVWFLPDIKGKVNDFERIRDLRITDEGTFTFLNSKSAIECTIDGKILWEAPQLATKENADSVGFYHHCFKKLKNGNYMVLGNKYAYKEVTAALKNKLANHQVTKLINGVLHVKVEYGTILEFDQAGNLCWNWDSADYTDDDELFSHSNADTIQFFGPHMNSFDINEEKGLISAGFRDISKIIIIEKTTKKVIYSFGNASRFKNINKPADFIYQHDSRFLKDGRIIIFNNNAIFEDSNTVSSVMILDPKSKFNPAFEFKCKSDSLSDGRSLKGGSIYETGNGNFIVSMGHLNRLFEITPSKKIVWDGFYEKKNKYGVWEAYPQYRICPAPSLYPTQFSLAFTKGNKLKITNIGHLNDTYLIQFQTADGKIIKSIKSKSVEAGKTSDINCKTIPSGTTSIEIISIRNKKLKKQIILNN